MKACRFFAGIWGLVALFLATGEVAHAAQLCPSFAQIDVIQNPSAWDRLRSSLSRGLMRLFGGGRPNAEEARPSQALAPAE